METSSQQSPLGAIESFSYTWLSNTKPSLEYESPRESIGDYFNFDAIAQTHEHVVIHADELFTNGFIRPVFIDPLRRDSCNTTLEDSIQTPTFSSRNHEAPTGRIRFHGSSMRKYGKSTKKMLRDLFEHLRSLWCLRKSTRVDDIERRITACTSMGGGDSCHLENSIYEAVLHCKRSIEK